MPPIDSDNTRQAIHTVTVLSGHLSHLHQTKGIEFNVKTVGVQILQRSDVTQTMLGGLARLSSVLNFLQYTCAKNSENWMAVNKVVAKTIRLTFSAHPVYKLQFFSMLMY